MDTETRSPETLLEAVQVLRRSRRSAGVRRLPALAERRHLPTVRRAGSRPSSPPGASGSARAAKKQFSVKVGTIFEDSPIGLDKWLPAFWMVVNCKNGISSYEIARALGVTQKTAWFMAHRIRLAMQTGTFGQDVRRG